MKVGLSATMIQGGRSGVAQYVLSVLRQLIERSEIELTVFVLEQERHLLAFAQDRCRVVVVPMNVASPVRNILWHQWVLPRKCRELGLDVLHIPSYRRLVLQAPCATVGTIHDLAPFHVEAKYDPARMFYGRVVVRHLARCQDELVAVSHCTATDIHRFFDIPLQRIRVIHNGIDHDRFQPSTHDRAVDFAASHGMEAPFFLYVSRLEHPGKNHVRLIRAFEQFKEQSGSDMQLAFGGGDWHGSEVIREEAAKSLVAADIRFLGFVKDEGLADWYRAAHAMVYPSLFEGFGLPPVEAMACGTPVISSTRGALEEVVADAALTIDPEDVDEIARAMTRIAEDGDLRGELRRKGLVNAARFDWAKTADALMTVYQRAAGS